MWPVVVTCTTPTHRAHKVALVQVNLSKARGLRLSISPYLDILPCRIRSMRCFSICKGHPSSRAATTTPSHSLTPTDNRKAAANADARPPLSFARPAIGASLCLDRPDGDMCFLVRPVSCGPRQYPGPARRQCHGPQWRRYVILPTRVVCIRSFVVSLYVVLRVRFLPIWQNTSCRAWMTW